MSICSFINTVNHKLTLSTPVPLTWLVGCLWALSLWWFPHPTFLYSSCRKLGPPPTAHCSRPLDLRRKVRIIVRKWFEITKCQIACWSRKQTSESRNSAFLFVLCTVVLAYLLFIKQADDDAKRPEVTNHAVGVALHPFLFEDVNQSLESQKQTDQREGNRW